MSKHELYINTCTHRINKSMANDATALLLLLIQKYTSTVIVITIAVESIRYRLKLILVIDNSAL